MFFDAFIRFSVYFGDFNSPFRCLSFQVFVYCQKFTGLTRRLFRCVLRLAVFLHSSVLMIPQYAQNTLRFTRPIPETFKVIISFSSFEVTVISLFCSYRDPCSFSCHSLSFRKFSLISVMHFVLRFHQMFIMQEI